MTEEQKEIIDLFFSQISDTGKITLHQVEYMLEIALSGVECKKDLCPSEILDIKNIKSLLKGL